MYRQILLTGATGRWGQRWRRRCGAAVGQGDGGGGGAHCGVDARWAGEGELERIFQVAGGGAPIDGRGRAAVPGAAVSGERGHLLRPGLGLGEAGEELCGRRMCIDPRGGGYEFRGGAGAAMGGECRGDTADAGVGGDVRRRRGPVERFLLVSSVFVSGSRTGRIDETATAEPPEFVTHYQRTKWESERVALASGLPVGVARISMVLGSHATGSVHRPGAIHSWIKWFARGLVPMVPGRHEARGDAIATEMAARCLARAVVADWDGAGPPIWHIAAADRAPRMSEIIDFVYEHFRRTAGMAAAEDPAATDGASKKSTITSLSALMSRAGLSRQKRCGR